jgi:hypothetical protein
VLWLTGASAVLLTGLIGSAASAQTGGQPTPPPAPQQTPAPTKAAPPPADEDEDDDAKPGEVKIVGHRTKPQYGAVVGDIKPEIQLSPADIQSYGVSTVTELLNELAPQTRSDRGRGASSPVVLLNGRRISSINEIQNIPTEAILRVDILPEEVSLKYGYTADQRVVNIVLRRRFRAITDEAIAGAATEGADLNGQAEVDQFQTRGDSRLNLDLKYQANGGITEADRGLNATSTGAPYALGGNVTSTTNGAQIDPNLSALVGQPVTVAGIPANVGASPLTLGSFVPTANEPNLTNTAADHSLTPATQSLTANAVMAKPIFWNMKLTLNATLSGNLSTSMQGLPTASLIVPAGDPFSPFSQPVTVDRYVADRRALEQTVQGWTLHLGSTVNRDFGEWRVSLTDAFDHADSQTDTDAGLSANALQALASADSASFNPFAPLSTAMLSALPQAQARSISNSGNIQFLVNGPLFKVPAGDAYVSMKAGEGVSLEASSTQRLGAFQAVSVSREVTSGQFNFDLPIASRTHGFLGAAGELSVNLNTALADLSDFGLLRTLGFGVNWTPVPGYNLIVSETNDHQAPTELQLGGPIVQTPGVRLYDYATGQSVSVTQISGGNPSLQADTRRVIKVGLTLRPWTSENFSLTANYINSRIYNAIATFPAASAAIEAAYPNRFVRDPDGDLIEEDNRPVNFAREDRQEIRWGFNYSRPVGKQPPPQVDFRAMARRRQAAGGGPGGPGGPAGASGPGGPGGPDGGQPQGGPPAGPGGQGSGPRPGGGGFGGGRGGGGGRGAISGFAGQPEGGRFQVALYHTVIFKDDILVRPGGPLLDLLNGAPAGGAGGQYQHEIEAQMGYTLNGYGVRLSADWKSATTVKGAISGQAGDLNFSDIGTINLRLWDNFAQQVDLVRKVPILKGSRVTLNVVNIFDQHINVHDTLGPTPTTYLPAYLDPTGRTISVSLRKMFF